MMNQSILKTNNLTKCYKNQIAVNNININVEYGDIYGLVGQNGAGKTTLMRMVSALNSKDSGEISIFGKTSQKELAAARRRMGAIIETPALYPNLTAKQNLEYYRKQRGISDKESIDRALNIAGLTHTGKKRFKNFSLGMKQRLGLALAMLSNPEFLMLDEPINGLDPTGIVEVREVLKRMNSEGITILISSHILSELSLLVTRYGFIHKGKLIKEITSGQLENECRLALHLEVDNSEKTAEILETKLQIHDYIIVSDYKIKVFDKIVNSSLIIKELVISGIAVNAASQIGDSLEDYYTNLIKEAEAIC